MNCLYCGKELTNRQTKYCSNQCQQAYQAQQKITAWQTGEFDGLKGSNQLSDVIRNYLLKKVDYKCERCGWGKINPTTGLVPLEIHHKDGDYRNNTEDNLEVLCPNCHSLTPNYKALNKEGRENREQGSSRKNYCIDCGELITDGAIRCKACASFSWRVVCSWNAEEVELHVSRDHGHPVLRAHL